MWWQLIQWVIQWSSPPAGYLLSDEAFFAQPASQQVLVLEKPDTLLLDIALFQATNEARRRAGLPILQYDPALYEAARSHAESMIQHNYYGHDDLYRLAEITLRKRIEKQTSRFVRMAENIGQYQTIDTPDWYSIRLNARTGLYEYLNPETKQVCRPYTYAGYARYAVVQWLNSPHHRLNLLNPLLTHVGCAARLTTDPYKERRAPFGRLVQNFGAPRAPAQASP
ncbi:hypothetical protein GCM10028773_58970 [Spirosoma koreense]